MPKKRLLAIEDDNDVADMLYVYFVSQGYEVLNALTGGDGVTMARAKSPNLILLDIMLPDMDGFDVCKVLRTTALTRHIPIIFLTQRDRRADKVTGLELGADDYVTKPFDIDELRLRVQGSLRRASREMLHDPRTGLPTSALVDEMYRSLQFRDGWTHLKVDIEGFKAFRDVYGFLAADEVLTFAGQVFAEVLTEVGTKEDFAGTWAESRFVIYSFLPDLKPLTDVLARRFAEGAQKFYNFTDKERGYVIINEAHDDEQFIPLMHFKIVEVETKPLLAPLVNQPSTEPVLRPSQEPTETAPGAQP